MTPPCPHPFTAQEQALTGSKFQALTPGMGRRSA